MKRQNYFLEVLILFLVFSFSCISPKKSQLDPASEDFFSAVRYIITKEESKIFSELPPSARPRFIEEFWERRDLLPGTKVNEYKEAYFQRIEEANRLFRGPRPGWLQDRGRIYILFGSPNERQTNPMGQRPIDAYEDPREMTGSVRIAAGEKPTEVWVYYNLISSIQKPHMVRLVFVDSHGSGDYTLTTDIDEIIPGAIHALIQPNLPLAHELHKEEAQRMNLRLPRALFDFSWELVKVKNKDLGSNLLVAISLPYKKIIFVDQEALLRARLKLRIELRDEAQGMILWRHEEEQSLDLKQEYFEQNKEAAWEVNIPVGIWLEKGKYSVYIRLENESGDQVIEKLLLLKM